MKKTILVISLALVIVIAASGSILLLNQTIDKKAEGEDVQVKTTLTEDTNQTLNVKILEFKFTSGWETPVGVMAAVRFNMTLQNLENKDVDGLMIEVKMLDANGSQIRTETYFYGPRIMGYTAQIEPFELRALESIVKDPIYDNNSSNNQNVTIVQKYLDS